MAQLLIFHSPNTIAMIELRYLFLFFIPFFALTSSLPAQTSLVDSLQQAVQNHSEDDEEKIRLLGQLALAYSNISPSECRRLAQEIRLVSLKIGYDKGIGISDQIIGISHSIQGDYGIALQSYLNALETFRRLDDSSAMGKNLSNIAGIYYNQGSWEKAEEYASEALKIITQSAPKDRMGIGSTALGLGLIKVKTGKFDEAFDLYDLAQEIFRQENNHQRIGMALSAIGELYEMQKDYSRAMYYMQQALELKEKIGDPVGQANTLLYMAGLLDKQGQRNKAKRMLAKSMAIAKEKSLNHIMAQVYKKYKNFSLDKGDYKSAYAYQELYMNYQDSISLKSSSKALAELKLKHSIESDRQRSELLQKDRKLQTALVNEQKATIRNQRIMNAAITILALSMLVLVITLLFNREKLKQSNRMLIQEQRKNSAKKVELEELNKSKDKWFALMCHDYKQPLTFLQGALDLLNEGSLSNQEQNMLLLEMHDRVKNTSSMLDNLLFWAQDQQHGIVVRKERLDMEVLVNENLFLLDSVLKKKNLGIQLEMGHRSQVWGDRHMLHLVTKNLLQNAIKLSKPHQKIRIYSEIVENKLCIHIADSGLSIPQHYLDQIFQFDSRRVLEGFVNERGLGVNLLIARDFIEKNGGKIWARNVSDIGNVFSFCLPYAGNFQGNEEFEMLFNE